ncbi:MAG TPA: hypothetical protein VFB23_00105 [Candidatus Acidoferrales bacterium]|nr:hypothetical protein [Candidatus Acidoferrales bacterium]
MLKQAQIVRPKLALFAVAVLSMAPALASARVVRDSEEFSGLLAQAKSEAAQVQRIAEEMYSFRFDKISWQTQAGKLSELKTHVNSLGEFLAKMNRVEAPSPWQQQAIADITPMVDELAGNVTMAIYHLSENPDRYVFTAFPEYVAANAESAANITDMLSEYVEYSEAKQTKEDIEFELELPTI